MLPRTTPPHWFKALARTFEFIYSNTIALVVLFLFGCTAFAAVAYGMAGSIPERKQELCEFLGHQLDCKIQWEAAKYGFATLRLSVDDEVGNPDDFFPPVATSAAVLQFDVTTINGVELPAPNPIAQVFQRVDANALWGAWWLSLDAPPCATPEQLSREGSLTPEGVYQCLTEAQVAERGRVAGMLKYSRGDWHMLQRLRQLHGANGVPVPFTVTNSTTQDEQGTSLPSQASMEVFYLFAVPAPGWTPPL